MDMKSHINNKKDGEGNKISKTKNKGKWISNVNIGRKKEKAGIKIDQKINSDRRNAQIQGEMMNQWEKNWAN